MLTYKASYKWSGGVALGSVLDFPGTIAYGTSLDEARQNLAAALRDMAETNLLKGEPLPLPEPSITDPNADIEEPIHLLLQTGQHVVTSVSTSAT
jgi:predicted RNase H-like HicB family nuclease